MNVIPMPMKIEKENGTFLLSSNTVIFACKETRPAGKYLAERVKPAAGFELPVKPIRKDAKSVSPNCMVLLADSRDSDLGAEGYTLSIEQDRVVVRSTGHAGAFYMAPRRMTGRSKMFCPIELRVRSILI